MLVAALLAGIPSTIPTATAAVRSGHIGVVMAQATITVDEDPGPRLQPVGNGDTIDSPAETTDQSNSGDTSWWWRVGFGVAVVVVVLVGLIQRRHVPDSAHGNGRGLNGSKTRRRDDRNALGH